MRCRPRPVARRRDVWFHVERHRRKVVERAVVVAHVAEEAAFLDKPDRGVEGHRGRVFRHDPKGDLAEDGHRAGPIEKGDEQGAADTEAAAVGVDAHADFAGVGDLLTIALEKDEHADHR